MRTRAAILFLWAVATCHSQPPGPALTDQDQAEIRAAVANEAAKENSRQDFTRRYRVPVIYNIHKIEPLVADAALVDADTNSGGAFPQNQPYVFILTRSNGHWTIARKIRVLRRPGPATVQPVSGLRRCEAPGSSGCPD